MLKCCIDKFNIGKYLKYKNLIKMLNYDLQMFLCQNILRFKHCAQSYLNGSSFYLFVMHQ